MVEMIMDIFLIYLGNWQFLGMIICLYYLLLKSFKNKIYYRFWNSIEFKWKWLPFSFATLFIIIFREYLLYPLSKVQSWMPQSFLWEQVMMWLYTTHSISIFIYSIFIFVFWKKFKSFIPALLIGLFSIGFIEFTFIPQHLIMWNIFIGFNWYYAFATCMIPLIVEHKRFYIENWKNMIVFLSLAILTQYLVLLLVNYSISVFDFEIFAWRLNYSLLPHPPFQTWVFSILQTVMKVLFLLALSNIRLKEESN